MAKRTYVIYGPRVSEESKSAVSEKLGYEEIPVSFGPFDSGALHCELFPLSKEDRTDLSEIELAARLKEKTDLIRGQHVVVIESTGEQPEVSESIERVKSAVDTLNDYGVAQVTAVMPNSAYDRQDRNFNEEGRLCSVNSKRFAKELKALGCAHVLTCTPHSKATIKYWQDAFGERHYHHLLTTDLFAEDIKSRFADPANVVVGAPDGADKPNDEGQRRARELACTLQGVSQNEADHTLFKIGKNHVADNETQVTSFEGDVAGKDCVIIDDMIDGGSTMINAAKELKKHGARSVTTYATHAICNHTNGAALERLLGEGSAIDNIVLSDTIPEIAEKRSALPEAMQERVSIISVGSILAEKLQEIEQQRNTHTARLCSPMINGMPAGQYNR